MGWLIWGGGLLVAALLFYRRGAAQTLDDLASARVRLRLLGRQIEDAERALESSSEMDESAQRSATAHLETLRARRMAVQTLEVALAQRCADRVPALAARLLFLPAPEP